MAWKAGDWAWSLVNKEPCILVEVRQIWGHGTVLAWLPSREAAVWLDQKDLVSYSDWATASPEHITYVAAAGRISHALERDTLLAPLEGTIIPLPHQIYALSRAMSGERVRYLLADEVGLGKTIEAGMILRELKIRGLVKRVLVVAPTGLVTQWVSEMHTHFNEEFRQLIPSEFSTWRRIAGLDEDENLWQVHDQVVCSLDSVKPLDSRRGWSAEQVARYNRERLEDMVASGWDLIIIDESHRLAGSTEQVARYRLGETLSQAAPYLLLLSATPHQGKTDPFRRLLSFLDQDAFPDNDAISEENVAPYVIRTEKRHAIDAAGDPLFKPRHTQLVSVPWTSTHRVQKFLYDAVTVYVREGYNQAWREKNTAIGFLMILFQRLVTSSVRAIRTALERRIEVLELPQEQASFFNEESSEHWADLDSQEQLESILSSRTIGLKNELAEVKILLSVARRCETMGPDIKAQALLDQIHQLQREEGDPKLKVLIFTEFVNTQTMLAEFLGDRGFPIVCLNGSLNLEQRQMVQRAFSEEARVLISTDAGGEGLNLQFCHVVFNYDLPWNPMKLEQRIGRVDRIGQSRVVRALNLALEDTVELRVREVLEEKLGRILEEFGVDKLADVLDSEEVSVDFGDLYMSAVLTPEEAEERAKDLAERVQERVTASMEGWKVLGRTSSLDPNAAQKIAHHQLPYWTERMTVSYLRMHKDRGGQAIADDVGYRLQWPDGYVQQRVVFTRLEAGQLGTKPLSLEHPSVRGLMECLPQFPPGQSLGIVSIEGISDKVSGTWSLWRIALRTRAGRSHRVMPLFISDEGRVLAPTARAVWDRLIELYKEIPGTIEAVDNKDTVGLSRSVLCGDTAAAAYEEAHLEAERQGRALLTELKEIHERRQVQQRRKGQRAFSSRRKAIERIGLSQVRNHRLRELDREEDEWKNQLVTPDTALPELTALLLVRVGFSGEIS